MPKQELTQSELAYIHYILLQYMKDPLYVEVWIDVANNAEVKFEDLLNKVAEAIVE